MGKKAREYKSGDFIFAKVKGYPAWPARVQRLNGKKYFVYFYGTGETANLPPNQIFDYAENKDKFLTKTQKRKDFNDGVRQIEHDFTNNVPLEEIIGPAEPMDTSAGDETANDSTLDETADSADTTAADTTADDENDTTAPADGARAPVEDSDDGALVIDEGGKKGKKSSAAKPKDAKEAKEPATPKAKEAKTPRGKPKKEDAKREEKKGEGEPEEEKKEEELVSRSGRKIRPKRFVDEQTEENATLPTPAGKKRRGASPAAEKEKEKPEKPAKNTEPAPEKTSKTYNAVLPSELEDLKEPYPADESDKENILICHLPSGQYVGIKLFRDRPASFKGDKQRLHWDRRQADNAITLKTQLERGHISAQSVIAQLETELNLTDEEKANLDKEREIEEKKCRVQFLKTEMKLIELDAKIKSCLSLEKADTELCTKLLDEMSELSIKPLMLLKHPTTAETVKRVRAYVGNAPSWQLSESDALAFGERARRIRDQADALYTTIKELFATPPGLSFWEYFSERVALYKKCTAKLTPDERLEMVHEPIELSSPSSHTMKAAIDAANDDASPATEEAPTPKKTKTPAKSKKAAASTPGKTPGKRQSARARQSEGDESKSEREKGTDAAAEPAKDSTEPPKDKEPEPEKDTPKPAEEQNDTNNDKTPEEEPKNEDKNEEKNKEETNGPATEQSNSEETSKDGDAKETESPKESNIENGDAEMDKGEERERKAEEKEKKREEKEKKGEEKKKEKEEREDAGEPRAKRGRECNKKTEPPVPRSPAKRKSRS